MRLARHQGGSGHCGILQALDNIQHDRDAMNVVSTDVYKISLCLKILTVCRDRRLFTRGLVTLYVVTHCFTEEPGLGAFVVWHTTEGQLGTTEAAEQRV
jgi:hypothetical protein